MRFRSVVLSLLALALMSIVVYLSDLSYLPTYLDRHALIVLGTGIIYTVLYLLRLLRNYLLFSANNFTSVSLIEYLPKGFIAGVVATYGPLKSGELLAMEIYHDSFGINRGHALSVIILGRVVDVLLVLGLVAMGGLVLSQEYFGSIALYLVVIVVLLILVIGALLSERFGMTLLQRIEPLFVWKLHMFHDFLRSLATDYYAGLRDLQNLQSYILLALLSLARWTLEVLFFYTVFFSFDFNLSFLEVMPIVGLSYAIGVSSGTPGGLGTSQLTAVGVLTFLGADVSIAGLSLLVITAISILINGGMAIIGFLGSLVIHPSVSDDEEVSTESLPESVTESSTESSTESLLGGEQQ